MIFLCKSVGVESKFINTKLHTKLAFITKLIKQLLLYVRCCQFILQITGGLFLFFHGRSEVFCNYFVYSECNKAK